MLTIPSFLCFLLVPKRIFSSTGDEPSQFPFFVKSFALSSQQFLEWSHSLSVFFLLLLFPQYLSLFCLIFPLFKHNPAAWALLYEV